MNVELENLDPRDRRTLEERARESGRPLGEILADLVHKALAEDNGGASDSDEGEPEESFYDAAKRLGFIGCIEGGPSDMSTNPKYMEGFGED